MEVDFLVSILAGAGDCGREEEAVEDDIPSPRGAFAANGRCVVFLGMAVGDIWVVVEEACPCCSVEGSAVDEAARAAWLAVCVGGTLRNVFPSGMLDGRTHGRVHPPRCRPR